MRTQRLLPVLAICISLSSCATTSDQETAIAETMNNEVAERQTTQIPSAADSSTLRRGEIQFLRCRSCHTTEEGGPHLTGPNLHGLFGADAGTKDGYPFSDALRSSGVTWTTETLDLWLKQPSAYIEQNLMVFAGIPDDSDRAALIAYLANSTR